MFFFVRQFVSLFVTHVGIISNAHRDGIDQLPVGLSNTVHRHAKLIRPRSPGGLCPKHTCHRNQFLLRVSGHQIFQRCSVSITPLSPPPSRINPLHSSDTRQLKLSERYEFQRGRPVLDGDGIPVRISFGKIQGEFYQMGRSRCERGHHSPGK